MNRAVFAVFVGLVLAATAFAQQVKLPRAKEPLMLCDFANAEAVRRWSGLKCEQAAVEGRPGMRFTFPKWEKGMNEWPAVYLRYDDGKGYPAKDWSHYGKIAFDASVEGDKPGDIALELRDTANKNGFSTHQTIAPGKVNHVELALADVRPEQKVENIEEIIFFASRPTRAYTITVANLRLLPGEKRPLAEFDLVYPNYRGLIFPDVDRITVSVATHTEEYEVRPEELQLVVTCGMGGDCPTLRRPLSREEVKVSLPTVKLPPGPAKVSVEVFGPERVKLAGREWPLRKLTAAEAQGLRVYIDAHNNTVVDGRPFFPLGFYGNGKETQAAEIADSPFNCILDYGTNNKPKAEMLKYLDLLQRSGLKLIYCLNDVYPAAKYHEGKAWEGVKGNEAIADAVVRAYRDHPAILAWYLNDELPRTMVPDLTGYYQRIRDADPNHPCYIVLCNMSELKYFPETTDVMGVDPYPIPQSPVTRVSEWMDMADAAVRGHMPVWLVPQSFAWYQHHPPGSNRARIPTAEDLRTGRAPTFEESRCMTYLALAHGAKGLIYWCYYNMRMLPQYPEMWAGMKRIGAEVKTLSPILLSPEDLGSVRFTPDTGGKIHTKLKRHKGREYLIRQRGRGCVRGHLRSGACAATAGQGDVRGLHRTHRGDQAPRCLQTARSPCLRGGRIEP